MKKTLKSIAMQLSDSDLQEIIRLKKMDDRKVVSLRRRRDKLAADLEKLDRQIAELSGGEGAEAKPARRGRKSGGKPGRKPVAATGEAKKKAAPARKAKGGKKRRVSLTAAVRDVLAKAGGPLKARQVVDALPESGVKVSDVSAMRKRISVILASQKQSFEQVERGVYQLKG